MITVVVSRLATTFQPKVEKTHKNKILNKTSTKLTKSSSDNEESNSSTYSVEYTGSAFVSYLYNT